MDRGRKVKCTAIGRENANLENYWSIGKESCGKGKWKGKESV